jgi:hypothetical protein
LCLEALRVLDLAEFLQVGSNVVMSEVFSDSVSLVSASELVETDELSSLDETVVVDVVGFEHVRDSVIND